MVGCYEENKLDEKQKELLLTAVNNKTIFVTPELLSAAERLVHIVQNPYKQLPNESISEWVGRMNIRTEYDIIIQAIKNNLGDELINWDENLQIDKYDTGKTELHITQIFKCGTETKKALEVSNKVDIEWIDKTIKNNIRMSDIILVTMRFRNE